MYDIQQRGPSVDGRLRGEARTSVETPQPAQKPSRKWGHLLKRMPKRRLRLIAGALVILVVLFFTYNYIQTRNELKRTADPQAALRIEAEKLAKEVGKFLELPEGETPTVATVKNKTQLNGQIFFERAENGDKVLIYPEAKRAVLYRPSSKKVVEYAPVETTQNQ